MASVNTLLLQGTETNPNLEQEKKKAGGEEGMEKKQNSEHEAKDELETAMQYMFELVEELARLQSKAERRIFRSTSITELEEPISDNSIRKLQRNLGLLQDDVRKLKVLNEEVLNEEVAEELRSQRFVLKNLFNQVAQGAEIGLTRGNMELEKINKKVFNLICQLRLLLNKKAEDELETAMQYMFKLVERLARLLSKPELCEPKSNTWICELQRNVRLLQDDVRKLKDLKEEVAEELSSQCFVLKNMFNQVAQNLWNQEAQGAEIGLTRGKKMELEKKQNSEHEEKKAEDEVETAIQYMFEYMFELVEKLGRLLSKPEGTMICRPTSITELGEPKSNTLICELQRNLCHLQDVVRTLKDFKEELISQCFVLETLCDQLERTLRWNYWNPQDAEIGLTEGNKMELEKINKKVFNLMCQLPLLPNKPRKAKGLDVEDDEKENHGKLIECLPAIHANEEDLKRLAVFKDVVAKFKAFEDNRKRIYLLSFAVFPENQEVNQTMLMYWWIGEGILDYKSKKGSVLHEKDRPENVVKGILNEFAKLKLIEPVVNRRKVEPNSYKMTPFVHASVVQISMEMKLFDIYRKGEKPIMQISAMNKVCLVEGSSSQELRKAHKMKHADLIESVFNVSERFPDFTFKWFSEDQYSANKKFGPLSKTTFKGLKVFYLGRWERTATRHIEVENPELMKYLKHMSKLKLLSFQGIARIERLDDAVCKLQELVILDLRDCYNLQKLPDKIDSLKALTYLDITDCHMIDRMPKRLSWLYNLEVLKGFVVSDATEEETVCTLEELKHLKKLRKLSVAINSYVTIDQLFTVVMKFNSLEKLKFAWGGINEHSKDFLRQKTMIRNSQDGEKDKRKKTRKNHPEPLKLSQRLRKLDLQCFPDDKLPKYLQPSVLDKLEKLYIKGGTKLTGFGMSRPEEKTNCGVKILRLKFLPRLKVEWRELQELYFPNLEFLEKYQCPQISFCPTDGIGIWRKEN